ncbi:uncharacterized protein BDR25DRAFT_358507 [Lindgomyces ingoldianus]|uniref:Uncharacterized protein n=1 Tax=Lindgomyces ingoldianus TaxID=673940 RepID=A0ACB6QKA7_9PLEO|nr:uncharacterized protein BDR25DRAFT_358507 [Lindgomyces ingoldianus]KAF2467394.1 hypothetical protein BDR25DRAFT_358507 [Lindgomyces ingoldianus]
MRTSDILSIAPNASGSNIRSHTSHVSILVGICQTNSIFPHRSVAGKLVKAHGDMNAPASRPCSIGCSPHWRWSWPMKNRKPPLSQDCGPGGNFLPEAHQLRKATRLLSKTVIDVQPSPSGTNPGDLTHLMRRGPLEPNFSPVSRWRSGYAPDPQATPPAPQTQDQNGRTPDAHIHVSACLLAGGNRRVIPCNKVAHRSVRALLCRHQLQKGRDPVTIAVLPQDRRVFYWNCSVSRALSSFTSCVLWLHNIVDNESKFRELDVSNTAGRKMTEKPRPSIFAILSISKIARKFRFGSTPASLTDVFIIDLALLLRSTFPCPSPQTASPFCLKMACQIYPGPRTTPAQTITIAH